jgi:hypothetical protein
MKILNHLFGKKTPTSLAIAAEIEKARAEHAAAKARGRTGWPFDHE